MRARCMYPAAQAPHVTIIQLSTKQLRGVPVSATGEWFLLAESALWRSQLTRECTVALDCIAKISQ